MPIKTFINFIVFLMSQLNGIYIIEISKLIKCVCCQFEKFISFSFQVCNDCFPVSLTLPFVSRGHKTSKCNRKNHVI